MIHACPKPAPKEKAPRKPLRAKTWLSDGPRTPLKKVGKQKPKRVKRYTAHLASKFWDVLRCLVYQRDGGKCQDCGKELTTIKEMHAAHVTNVRFGNENLEDVKCSCVECNMAERASRAWYAGTVA